MGPFGLFIALQELPGVLRAATSTPEFWVYPIQTLACATLLVWSWRAYPRAASGRAIGLGLLAGAAVFILWISPQAFFHAAPRVAGGFNPNHLPAFTAGHREWWYRVTVALRFARLVLVVPALEEVFWRGFLLRYLVREDFTSVPFGTFAPLAFAVVTIGFMLEHSRPDWPAALATGAIYNLLAIRTKSLPACIAAHALTNLLLGIYIMRTGQWGFW